MSPTRPSRRTAVGACVALVTVVAVLAPALAAAPASAAHGANVTVYRTDATLDSAAAVEAGIADGTVAPADTVTVGETLVVAVDSPRLAAAIDGEGSTTERFLAALDDEARFRILQTNPTPMRNRKVGRVDAESVTVVRDGSRVYALVDTAALDVRYREVDDPAAIHGGERFAVALGYGLGDLPGRSEEPTHPVVEFASPAGTGTTAATPPTGTPTRTTTTPTPDLHSDRSTTTATPDPGTEPGTATTDAVVPGFTAAVAVGALLAVVLSSGIASKLR